MKKIIIFLQLFCSLHILCAQNYNIDSLKKVLTTNIDDSTRLENLFQIVILYIDNNLDSSLKYVKQFNQIPSKSKKMEAHGLGVMGNIYLRLGNASKSLETLLKALKIEETLNDSYGISMLYWNIGKVYQSQNDNEKAISYYFKSLKISSSAGEQSPQSYAMGYLGEIYMNLNRLDSALYYTQLSYEIGKQVVNPDYLCFLLTQFGNIYQKSGNTNLALNYYRMAIKEALPLHNFSGLSESYIDIARLLKKNKVADSCYYYARESFSIAEQLNYAPAILKASNFLKDFFKDKNMLDSAFKYQEIEVAAKDSMLSLEKIKSVQSISFEEQQRIQEVEAQKKDYQNKIKLYALIFSLAVFLFLAIFLYRSNRHKQRAKIEIERAYEHLKTTQAQLIQSEKMASLGELTAGIAHEIQNPLNFVNNFSELNTELIDELDIEIHKGNINEAKIITNDIRENEQKINHHGRRADAIVKGMLQHSRHDTGQKEPTDINTLADEYLRLAYHGLRAKDSSFNISIQKDFDESITKINIVPQDIGRVLLNLYNNAFYAVTEKKKNPQLLKGSKEYEPTVTVSTRSVKPPSGGLGVLISVKDNGNGIPQKALDKIFQPFFTTKPTGQGTGLGLSLSYDIVKAHGGEIKVDTTEGKFAEFVIRLPILG